MNDEKLDRLLRSAAEAKDSPFEVPFGFETRVVALWRAGQFENGNGLTRFVRRVAFAALAIIVLAGAATFYQLNQDSDLDEPYANEYAIADSAIQGEF